MPFSTLITKAKNSITEIKLKVSMLKIKFKSMFDKDYSKSELQKHPDGKLITEHRKGSDITAFVFAIAVPFIGILASIYFWDLPSTIILLFVCSGFSAILLLWINEKIGNQTIVMLVEIIGFVATIITLLKELKPS